MSALLLRPEAARAAYVFAHGAGAGMAHPSMAALAEGLAERGIATLRYQFPYMEKGGKRPDLTADEALRSVRAQIEDVIGIDASEAVLASAKSGLGIEDVLEAVVARLPAPKGDANAPLKAMLVDAWYDPYLGVVVLVRVFDGVLKAGMRVKMMRNGSTHLIDRVGVFLPKNTPVEQATTPQ